MPQPRPLFALPHRRFLATAVRGLARAGSAVALGAALLAGCGAGAGNALAQPSYTVSPAQLDAVLAERFPRSVPVQGLLTLTVQSPRLRLLPATNRLLAELTVEAAGPALRRSHAGQLDVEFALRYEPSDRTLRAHQLKLARLDFPTLRPAVAEMLGAYGPAVAEQALREVTLHQLRPADTAMLDGLGLQPGSITVTDKGLVVSFVPKTGSLPK